MFKLADIIDKKGSNPDQFAFKKLGDMSSLLSGEALVQQLVDNDKEKLNLKYAFPATLKAAKIHTRAIKYGFYNQTGGQKKFLCPCCQLQINTQPLQIFKQHTTVLFQTDGFRLSSCIAFFFTFIKYLIALLLIRTLLLDIFNIATNLSFGTFCYEKCSKQFWSLSSIIHKYNRQDLVKVTNILVFAVSLVYFVCFIIYRYLQYTMYQKIDQFNQTQDDFSLFVENIPILNFPQAADSSGNLEFNYDQDLEKLFSQKIKEWIEVSLQEQVPDGTIEKDYMNFLTQKGQNYSQVPDDIIKSITLCYDLTPLEKISQLRDQLMMQHEADVSSNPAGQQYEELNEEFDTIPQQIRFLNTCELDLVKSFAIEHDVVFKSTHFVGSAFISFKYQHYRDYLLELYDSDKQAIKMKTKYLRIQQAPFPTDVNWKNIKISDSERRKRVFISYGILLMILLLAFCLLVGSDRFRNALLEQMKKSETVKQQDKGIFYIDIHSTLITLITTLVTMGINSFLWIASIRLNEWQKHQSKARAKSSFVLKLLITQFLNTAMIYLVLSKIRGEDEDGLLSEQGLIYQITNMLVLSGLIQIVNNLIFQDALIRWAWNTFAYRNKNDNDQIQKFQVNLNRQFQLLEFDLTTKYSYYLLQFYTASFYAYAIPVLSLAVAIIFVFQYWVDKLNLFRRCSMFYELGYAISKDMVKMAEVSIFFFALGAFYFYMRIHASIDPFLLVSLIMNFIFVMVLIFLPEKIAKKCICRAYETCEPYEYDQCITDGKFKETYWINNPATMLINQRIFSKRKVVENHAAQNYTVDTTHDELEDQITKNIVKYPI